MYLTHNPYHGINAHFNSYLQNKPGGWMTFHNNHIVHLTETLNQVLPQGYYAVSEDSLQIQLPFEKRDTTIAFPEENLRATEIYDESDKLITRLELLSPTNKKSSAGYLTMRQKMLNSGINMIELDYLHEIASLFPQVLPDYPRHEADAFPYYIVINDPRPQPDGVARFYCFHVDDRIPELIIPLSDSEGVRLNFDEVYQETYKIDRRAHIKMDYAQVPVNFASYSGVDQTRIKACMARISG